MKEIILTTNLNQNETENLKKRAKNYDETLKKEEITEFLKVNSKKLKELIKEINRMKKDFNMLEWEL